MSSQTVCAILVAAGTGSRLASDGVAKQFLELAGYPTYEWSLKKFCEHSRISNVVIVTTADMLSQVKSRIGSSDKRIDATVGGITRQESVLNGLRLLSGRVDPDSIVLIHDAARPFLTSAIIDATIEGVEKYGACTAAIKCSDTIKRVWQDLIFETLNRDELVMVQTPQAARFKTMYAAHQMALDAGVVTTDDAAILEAAGNRVAIVEGSIYNFKITQRQDLELAEVLAEKLLLHSK